MTDPSTKDYLTQIARQEKQFDALYRRVGVRFGLPDCTMWVLYFLISAEGNITQQELIGKMMFPKQTINSAVMNLDKKGFVTLRIVPGTRNRKTITLTKSGRELAKNTVERMLKAELYAVNAMGAERISQYIELYHVFYNYLQEEFRKEGLSGGD